MSHNLTPMQVCERLIGKPEQIAVAAKTQEKAPYHWRHERTGRAAGDLPSATVMRNLLDFADTHRIPLTADHLIWGATEAEVAALQAMMRAAPMFTTSREAAE